MPVSRSRLAVATTVALAAALAPAGPASAAGHHAKPHAKKHAVAKKSHKAAAKAKKGAGIRRSVAGASRSFTSADGTSIGTITAFDAASGRIRLVLEDGSVVESRLSPDADVRCAPAAGFAAEDLSSSGDGTDGVVADAQSAGYEDGYSDGAGSDAPDPTAGRDGMTAAEAAAYTAAYTAGYADGSTGADMADPGDPTSATSPNDGDGCLALLDAGMKVYGVAVKATPRGRSLTELDVIVTPARLAALNAADDQGSAGDPGADDPGAADNGDDAGDDQGDDN